MGKKLAIKGHPTRGKEVIELLEMMGGKNKYHYKCIELRVGFTIGSDGSICRVTYKLYDEFRVFTLEEFLEKFPYKVGDKVIDDSGESGIIIEMKWDEEIIYKVDFGKECYYFTSDFLRPYKETNMNENKFGTAKEPLELKSNAMKLVDNKCERTHEDVIFDSIIWHLRNSVNNGKQNLSGGECEDYFREVVKKNNENKMKNVLAELLEHIKTTPKEELEKEFNELEEWSNVGPTVEEFMDFCDKVNKKPEYPKTYEECYDENNTELHFIYVDMAERDLYESFIQLIRCRNAYWKIYGEQMGLGGPWEPNWEYEAQVKYMITTFNNKLEFFFIYT